MKKIYCKAIVSISALAVLFGSALFLNNTYSAYFTMQGNTFECTDPTADGYNVNHDICYSWCFVEETKVTMADGSEKNIEDVVQGDWLKGSIGPNKVQYVIRKFNEGKVYSFNGGRYFVTDSHPFKTTEGWKSINPEATKLGHPGVDVEKLEIGDVLITENGDVELKSIEGKDEPQEVYTFVVDGTHDYYADGYLVHNKYAGNNGSCPAGWYEPGGPTYDWSYSVEPFNQDACVLRDLGQPVLIGSGGGGTPMADIDIMNMIYWDKDGNDTYDDGTDRPLLVPTYAISTSGSSGYPYYLANPYYFVAAGFWYNNSINLSQQGLYTFGVSQGSVWANLVNQGFTTDDPTTGSELVAGGFGYITGLQLGLEYSCAGTGTQTVAFIEYSCPAGYIPSGSSCYTGSTMIGGPCTTNADCSGGGTCNGYSYTPPNSLFKYDGGGAWNASHPNWNDSPHGNAGGLCRDGDDANGCVPNDPNQDPNWYGGGVLCGCGNFIPNNDSNITYGACTTSSSNYIPAEQITVTEVVACTGTGGSCTPNRTCGAGYTLTGDTNGDGTPNCMQTTCTTTTGSTTGYYYPYDRTQPGPISVGCYASEDGYSNSCGTSFWNINCSLGGGIIATTDINVEYKFRAPGDPNCVVNATIPNGANSVSTTLACGCSIASTPEGESLHVISPTSMDGRWFSEYFIFQSSTGVDINNDMDACGCDAGAGSQCPSGAGTGPTQLNGTYGYCGDYIGGVNYEWNIYGYRETQTIGGGQTICSNDFVEATDTNNCGNCVTTTEAPTLCDINDPLMAGVCYIPGGYGTTLLVSDGKIGINNASPEYALDVDGTIRAAEVITLSDARLKSSIEKIDSALEKIRAINGYIFTWKDSGEPDLGVLAQEVEKVFANAVETDVTGKKTVQYNALLAPIVEAIHELNTQIDILYNEKFDNQVKRIEAIEKIVK